ncbi:sugar phosphate isomerase/epimerase family protein [Fictibacillus fluitans]|uniref:Sugar phosphate isomerase/epimerase n=1 Tax=Fictibacillus fluitans TaxID=3058422 RepID=A0ABT8HRQ7_9BACL|nr:sugar phosphate isomerase/epimerase [Fictibacillus sp. NE201]MDN4522977.1 sugar phosphate isomerase/epimerase [Fictibacillus sp. NE201]
MIKLGVNSVLFKDFDFETAAKHIALAGYDGIEIAAIKGMCEHLALERWEEQSNDIVKITEKYGLELLSMEVASLDEERLEKAFEAAAAMKIPVVNVGPGGKSEQEGDLQQSIGTLNRLSKKAETYGVTLCVKAHVGQSIFNTPTTMEAIKGVTSPAFGIDMDPSHIYRGNENPEDEIRKIIGQVKHVHIRDCKGRTQGPGAIENQACGRGDIDLFNYCKALVDANYSGPVCLEVIGAKEHSLTQVSIIAAESYGYLNACLKFLKANQPNLV